MERPRAWGKATTPHIPPRGKTCLFHSQAATDRQARAFSVRSGAWNHQLAGLEVGVVQGVAWAIGGHVPKAYRHALRGEGPSIQCLPQPQLSPGSLGHLKGSRE